MFSLKTWFLSCSPATFSQLNSSDKLFLIDASFVNLSSNIIYLSLMYAITFCALYVTFGRFWPLLVGFIIHFALAVSQIVHQNVAPALTCACFSLHKLYKYVSIFFFPVSVWLESHWCFQATKQHTMAPVRQTDERQKIDITTFHKSLRKSYTVYSAQK